MKIQLENSNEKCPENTNFSIVTYTIQGDQQDAWPDVSILISCQAWRERTNVATPDRQNVVNYLIKNGEKFIQTKIDVGDLKSSDEMSPALEPKIYIIASNEYKYQNNETPLSFKNFENINK